MSACVGGVARERSFVVGLQGKGSAWLGERSLGGSSPSRCRPAACSAHWEGLGDLDLQRRKVPTESICAASANSPGWATAHSTSPSVMMEGLYTSFPQKYLWIGQQAANPVSERRTPPSYALLETLQLLMLRAAEEALFARRAGLAGSCNTDYTLLVLESFHSAS